jgi:hypothetical protein
MGQPGVTKSGLLQDMLRNYLKDSLNQIRARGIPFAPILPGLLQKKGEREQWWLMRWQPFGTSAHSPLHAWQF